MGITNPVKAIRAKCLDCSGGQTAEVKLCDRVNCPLYPFRMGTNPFRAKRVMSEEQRAKAVEQLSHFRRLSAEKNQTTLAP